MVHFVGAGSGAEDLITLRGKKYIEEADVIIYAGSLVNPALLKWVKDGCEIYDSSRMHLGEIAEVIKKAEEEGKTTVRLHTGDPSLYGAIREQIGELSDLGIDCDVCPGVSSFLAAAAALKAEYTIPGVSQTVILTRMEGRTPVPEREAIEKLAPHGASMVVFLSAGMLRELSERLIEGGYAPDTPAAIVYRASWPDEKVIRCSVAELPDAAHTYAISRQALILVGDFLGDKYEKSRLYDPEYSTAYRKGVTVQPAAAGSDFAHTLSEGIG